MSEPVEVVNKAPVHTKVRQQGSSWVPYAIIAPALLITAVVLVPFGISIYYSLTDYRLVNTDIQFIGLGNYIDLISSGKFWNSTRVTFTFAFSAVGIEVVFGAIIAFLLNTEVLLAKVFRPLLLLPLMIAPILGTIMWKLMMSPSFGVLNYFLSWFGMRDFPWASSSSTAMFSVVLIDVWMFTPFIALLLLAGLRSMPETPFEAARVDGASRWFIFKNLTVPMLMPYLLIAVIFRLIDSLRQFDIIYGMTKGGPGDTLMNYQVSAYNNAFSFMNIAEGSALMILNWIIIYVISFYLVKYWRKSQDRLA